MAFGDVTRVFSNIQSMQALGNMQSTNQKLGMHQMRLSTGSRLNRAEDDSASYTIAKKLESKVRGQAQALANIGDAKSMLTVAEGSLNSVMDIMQTMKEKAVQAANDTLGDEEREAIETELDALYNEIGDVLADSEFNGKALFDGDTLQFQVGAAQGDSFSVQMASLGKDDVIAGVSSDGRAASVSTPITAGEGQYSDWTGVNGGITVTDNGYTGSQTGSLYFKFDDANSRLIVSEENTAQGFSDAVTNGDTVDLTGYTAGTTLTFDGIDFEFDDALADLGDGEGFKLDVTAAIAAGTDTYVGQLNDADDAAAVIGNIDDGIDLVAEELSKLGDAQNRLSFKHDNLESSMTNTEAARSRIEDADFAKEQMEIVKLQILQQTGMSTFAQSNAAPQSILSIF